MRSNFVDESTERQRVTVSIDAELRNRIARLFEGESQEAARRMVPRVAELLGADAKQVDLILGELHFREELTHKKKLQIRRERRVMIWSAVGSVFFAAAISASFLVGKNSGFARGRQWQLQNESNFADGSEGGSRFFVEVGSGAQKAITARGSAVATLNAIDNLFQLPSKHIITDEDAQTILEGFQNGHFDQPGIIFRSIRFERGDLSGGFVSSRFSLPYYAGQNESILAAAYAERLNRIQKLRLK